MFMGTSRGVGTFNLVRTGGLRSNPVPSRVPPKLLRVPNEAKAGAVVETRVRGEHGCFGEASLECDTTCPPLIIQPPAGGGTVNAGETVTVVAVATDNGPSDTGVTRFEYGATGEVLVAPMAFELPSIEPGGAGSR